MNLYEMNDLGLDKQEDYLKVNDENFNKIKVQV